MNTLMRGDTDGRMHPNPRVIALADDCLFRYGRVNAAPAEVCPRYAKLRELWRDIEANPDAYREKVRRVLSKRSGG